MKIQSAINYSHMLIKEIIQPGNNVIDATVGNGNDTQFLAQLVGKKGHVFGFDIQKKAVQATTQRLTKHNLINNVTLFNTGHENITNYITVPIQGAIFNLGYLPGSDHKLITHGNTTIKAIKGCLQLLQPNGIIIIVVYYGHPGGENEKELVTQFVTSLEQKKYTVLQYRFLNQIHQPPFLLAIQRR